MNKTVIINDCERIDDLQRGGLRIIQDSARFCFGVDAVLLAGFVRLGKKDFVLDLCTGTGVIPLLLAGRYHQARFSGIEIQAESVDMARRSIALNNLEDRINIVYGDIKRAGEYYKSASFDVITANPPYIKAGSGIIGENAIARHELMCGIDDVAACASKLLKPGGAFFMVHRPNRLADIIYAFGENKLGPSRLRFVSPFIGREPRLILLEGIRGRKPELKVLPELIIYNSDRTYTDEVARIYED